jgi:hypothetical protein
MRIRISTDPALNRYDFAKFSCKAEIDNKETQSPTIMEWQASVAKAKGMLGFYAAGLGGATLVGGDLAGGVKTKTDYDGFGRQMISFQEFDYGGMHYSIAYSGVTLDGWGRLATYAAEIKEVK